MTIETAVAADGPEALRIAEKQGPFDLLLADVVTRNEEATNLPDDYAASTRK